jgi:hypothetical protein
MAHPGLRRRQQREWQEAIGGIGTVVWDAAMSSIQFLGRRQKMLCRHPSRAVVAGMLAT